MKICQVVTGIIPVPNNRWGAVEKIIWEYKRNLELQGHECDVKYLNEVKQGEYDFVHIHMANLCIEAQNRGIDYVFSIHDHHAEYYGKGSHVYNMNLSAMKGSIFSICHTPHYLELFDEVDKLFYLRHGVNTSFFTAKDHYEPHSILMVANNGLAGDYSIDRKGFEIGIRAAAELYLPITIIGAEANKKFFELKPELLDLHDQITIISDNPTDDVVLEHYHKNTIFLHPSFLEAGHPNLTLLEAASCCLNIVATCKADFDTQGFYKLESLDVDEVVSKIETAINNDGFWVRTDMAANREKYDWKYVVHDLIKYYSICKDIRKDNSSSEVHEMLKQVYVP
jgi:glycosyltransferase involved in cell wall biosynthesis